MALHQISKDGEEHPVYFESKKLQPSQHYWETHNKELAVIKFVLVKFQHYLYSHSFEICTDHNSLKYLLTQPKLNPQQIRALELLQSYEYNIKYLPGAKNVVADALSRINRAETESLSTVEEVQLNVMFELVENSMLRKQL